MAPSSRFVSQTRTSSSSLVSPPLPASSSSSSTVWGSSLDNVIPTPTRTVSSKPRATLSLSLDGFTTVPTKYGSPSPQQQQQQSQQSQQQGTQLEGVHPLKYNWEAFVSHRTPGAIERKSNGRTSTANKDDAGKNAVNGKEKEADWAEGVVRLGSFSSIESLHPFLAHLTPSSSLPSSKLSTHMLFNPTSFETPPPVNNLISDINIFRSPIRPIWEDPHNVGGGRWTLRLRKGCSDRIFEEIVYALVGERIGGEADESIENDGSSNSSPSGKVNGVVLSVRKEEDILSLWCAPTSSRGQRESIRDSIRAAIEHLLSPLALASLVIEFKPHPVAGTGSGTGHTVASLKENSDRHHHSHSHRDNSTNREDRREGGGGGGGERREGNHRNGERSSNRNNGFGSLRGERGERERTPGGEGGEYGSRERSNRTNHQHHQQHHQGEERSERSERIPRERPSASGGWGK